MFCHNCGKEVDDNAYICPNCGVIVGQSARPATPFKDENNILAIVGFALSFFIPLAGLICSIFGYNKAKNEGLPYKNLALAGIIISAVSMVLSVVFVIGYCVFIIALMGSVGF